MQYLQFCCTKRMTLLSSPDGADFIAEPRNITFAPNARVACTSLPLVDDTTIEQPEAFRVRSSLCHLLLPWPSKIHFYNTLKHSLSHIFTLHLSLHMPLSTHSLPPTSLSMLPPLSHHFHTSQVNFNPRVPGTVAGRVMRGMRQVANVTIIDDDAGTSHIVSFASGWTSY